MRLALIACLACACTSRGPVPLTTRELKAIGTKSFEGDFTDVYDAAYLSLEQHEGRISSASRLEGVIENDKVEFSPPAGFDGLAYRSYAVSVFQDGSKVAVSAVPRLWSGDRDVSDEPWWVLPGSGGEEAHWDRLFTGVQDLLDAWRNVPELAVEKSRGGVSVLGVRFTAPPDWRGLEQSVDRRTVVAQAHVRGAGGGCAECPGGMNPTIVFEVQRRYPAPDAPKLHSVALERALGPKVVEPEAWETQETPTGVRGTGQVVAESGRTAPITWHVWDAREPAFMIRAAAACGPPETPAGCETQWDAMINGVSTDGRRR